MMRIRTGRMFAHASRDYQRQLYVPTRRTNPVLHKRRYSIDVNTGVERREIQKVCTFPQHTICRRSLLACKPLWMLRILTLFL